MTFAESTTGLPNRYNFARMVPKIDPEMFERMVPKIDPEMFERMVPKIDPEMFERMVPKIDPEMFERMVPKIDPEMFERMVPKIDPEMFKRMVPKIDPEMFKRMVPKIDPVLVAQNVPVYPLDEFGLVSPHDAPDGPSPRSVRGPVLDIEVRRSEVTDSLNPLLGDVGSLLVVLSLAAVLSSVVAADRVATSALFVIEQLLFLLGLIDAVAARQPAVGGASLVLTVLTVASWSHRSR